MSDPPPDASSASDDADGASHASALPSQPLPDLTRSQELFQRFQEGGDAEAFGELLERYRGRLERIMRIRISARLRRFVDSADIVQSAFLRAVEREERAAPHSHAAMLSWLTRIAERCLIDEVRRHEASKRDVNREQPLSQEGGPGASSIAHRGQATPSKIVSAEELQRHLDAYVAELESEDQRQVVLLKDYHHASWDEISQLMPGRNKKALQQLHARAKLRLAQRMAPHLRG